MQCDDCPMTDVEQTTEAQANSTDSAEPVELEAEAPLVDHEKDAITVEEQPAEKQPVP